METKSTRAGLAVVLTAVAATMMAPAAAAHGNELLPGVSYYGICIGSDPYVCAYVCGVHHVYWACPVFDFLSCVSHYWAMDPLLYC